MSTNSNRDLLKHFDRSPPPAYTIDSTTGSASFGTTSLRRNVNESIQPNRDVRYKEEGKLRTLLQLGSIIVLLLCALSCILALHRNTKIMEQNLALLDKQIELLARLKNAAANFDAAHNRMKRMADQMYECPPCPTDAPPTPIEPHRNPVSVLNEKVGQHAQYEVLSICKDPPIHTSTVKIVDDPSFTGKSWSGKGKTKQSAKQAAAWEAIKSDFPELIDAVAEEHKPPLYNPICNGHF